MANPSDFGFVGNIAVSIPGLLFLVYLIDLFYRLKITLPLSEGLKETLFVNESFVTTIFIVFGIAIGAYIFLYSLRFYSYLFDIIFCGGMAERDSGHNFWRQFSISLNFAFFLMLLMETIFIAFSGFSLLALLLIIFLITFIKTFLLHNDIKIMRISDRQKEKWKTFNWDGGVLDREYYTFSALTIIAQDQHRRLQELEKIRSKA